MSKPAPPTEENQGGQRPQGRSRGLTARSPGAPGNNPRPSNYTSFPSPSLSFLFPLFFSVILFSTVFPLCLVLARLCWLLPPLYRVLGGGRRAPPHSHITQVEVRLLYPPVRRDLLRLVALHVFLHGGEAGAVFRADGTLVWRGTVVCSQVLDHGRVVSGALVAKFALKGLLTCGRDETGQGTVKTRRTLGCPWACWRMSSLVALGLPKELPKTKGWAIQYGGCWPQRCSGLVVGALRSYFIL